MTNEGLQADAIDRVAKLVEDKRDAAAKLAVHNLPDNRYVVMVGTNKIEEGKVDPESRKHLVDNLDDLLAMLKESDTVPVITDHAKPSLWYDAKNVTVLFDDVYRRDFARFELKHHPRFLAVGELLQRPLSQKDLLRILKTDLRAAVDPQVITSLRSLNFKRFQEDDSVVNPGSSKLGRSVEAKVTAAGDIPEELHITTPVYINAVEDFAATVDLDIEVDLENQQFRIRDVDDSYNQAKRRALAALREVLDEQVDTSVVAIFNGRP